MDRCVELISVMGDDLTIVNAARVSYNKKSELMTEADEKLIGYLAKNSHGTPFEHVVFTFRVKAPIAVAREWMRHRIGSFNEVSTRYVEVEKVGYVPELDDVRKQIGKPGQYMFEPLEIEAAQDVADIIAEAYTDAYGWYEELLDRGVAKELARNVLPLGSYTEFYWTVNFRSLTNFLSLRNHPAALLEIQRPAAEIEAIVAKRLPVAMKAWEEGGRRPL